MIRPRSHVLPNRPHAAPLVVCLLVCGLFLSGCMSTRGIIYLNPERSGAYLAKEKKPTDSQKKQTVEAAVEKARVLLRTVPDGNRILGGYCTDSRLARQISDIQDLAPTCRVKLKKFQNKSNFHTSLFWGFLGGTAATGIAMVIGGLAPEPGEVKAGLVIGFGIPMVALALTNAVGPFARIASRERTLGERIDNYMWTLRRRISVEVCTAPNRATAAYRLAQIHRRIHKWCTTDKPETGLYVIPNQ